MHGFSSSLTKFCLPFGAIIALTVGGARPAQAALIIVQGNATGSAATASVSSSLSGDLFTFTVTNTSPLINGSTITGIGFDLIAGDFTGNNHPGLNGFNITGIPPTTVNSNFQFTDGDAGNVPQFNSAVLDFAFTSGSPGNFNGQTNAGLAPGESDTFRVRSTSSPFFAGLTDEQILSSIFVRFQGITGAAQGSDVGRGSLVLTAAPEPTIVATAGSGLLVLAVGALWRRRRAV